MIQGVQKAGLIINYRISSIGLHNVAVGQSKDGCTVSQKIFFSRSPGINKGETDLQVLNKEVRNIRII